MSDILKTDLQLTWRGLGRRSSDRTAVNLIADRGDLGLISGRANLAQAIVNRLLTRQGELTDLGHPDYGSRLYQLIGQPQSRRTHTRAEFYVRESLAAEPRIAEIVAVSIAVPDVRSEARSVLAIEIIVRPSDASEPLTIALAVNLES